MRVVDTFIRILASALHRRMVAKYEGARHTRITPQRRDPGSADAHTSPSGPQLRENARNLDDNHDLAASVLTTLCAKGIATGLVPEPMVRLHSGKPAVQFNDALSDLHTEWAERPEVTRTMSDAMAQDLAFRTWMRDGEVFDQLLIGENVRGLTHGPSGVPFSFELLEPDYFPFDYHDPAKNIVQSVQKNGWGRPVAYFKWTDHPGDIAGGFRFTSDSLRATGSYADLKRVPAERILHTALRSKRLHQTRGIGVLAVGVNRLRGLKHYDETENVAARVAAAACYAITTQAPAVFDPEEVDGKRPTVDMDPGMGFRLAIGEDVKMINPMRPNPELTNYRNSQLRALAAGTGVAFSTIARLYDTSYTAMRQETVDTEVNYRRTTAAFADMRLKPMWRRFVVAATLSRLRVPRDVDRNTLFRVMYPPPPTPWIDPLKEAQAAILRMTGGESGKPLESWTSAARRYDANPRELLKQIEEEGELFSALPSSNPVPKEAAADGQSEQENSSASQSQAA